jgi:hypothetical protein
LPDIWPLLRNALLAIEIARRCNMSQGPKGDFDLCFCDRPALNCNRSALNADAQLEAIFLRA